MNDSYAGEVVILIMSLFAFVIPFFGFLWSASWASKGLGKFGQALQSGLQRTARRAGNMGKKAAMGSKYGQAAQQFMGQRKSIAQLKGRETLRGALNSNPNLARLMGGVGGQQHASRFLSQENRKHEAEQIQELSKNISLPMANAIANKENLLEARRTGRWQNNKELKSEEREGIRQMQAQGYIGADGKVGAGQPHSAIAASAALQELYTSDDITAGKVQGLGSLLKGGGTEANSNFTKLNRDLAVRGKNKNVAFASFDDGKMEQFTGKKPAGIVDSGLNGMNKDALKPSNHDLDENGNDSGQNAILTEVERVTHGGKLKSAGGVRDYSAIVERTKQTMDQNHQEVLQGLSDAMGFANVEEFKALRTALTSGGGAQALPPEFRAAMGGTNVITPPTAPPVAPPQPQLIVPHGPTGNGPTSRSRPSNFPPAGP